MSMRAEIASLHSRTNEYRRKLRRARETVERALEKAASPYVALSGGKDSTVVMHLARALMPEIPCWYSDDEWWLPETAEYIQRLRTAGVDVHQVRTTMQHTEWFTSYADLADNDNSYTRDQGWDCTLLGLRQEESSRRRVYLRTYGPLHLAKDGVWRCNPLHDWKWTDVWAYIVSGGIDYNRAYDRLEEIGIPPDKQRIGPLAVERVLGYGQLAILKRGWPELFDRFAERYPEARAYV